MTAEERRLAGPSIPSTTPGQGPGQASYSTPRRDFGGLSQFAQREEIAAQRGGSEGISFLESCEMSPAAVKLGSCWDEKFGQNIQFGRIRDKQPEMAQQELSFPTPTLLNF